MNHILRAAVLFVFLGAGQCRALTVAEIMGTPAAKIETRIIDNSGSVLISSGDRILAAVFARPSGPEAVSEIISAEAARALLASVKPLATESTKPHDFPIAPEIMLNLLTRVRPVGQGCRLLAASFIHRGKTAAANVKLPAPPPFEVVVQLFPDPKGAVPKLIELDGTPASVALIDSRQWRARELYFQTTKEHRVRIERSGSCAWTVNRSDKSLLLTAPLLADPHEPAQWGAFELFVGAAHDDEAPEVSLIRLDRGVVPARDFVEGSLRVYAAGADPFLLQDVAVLAEIALPPRPDGSVPTRNLPCYFWEPPDEKNAEAEYRFRFAPPSEGLYGVRVIVSTSAAKCTSEPVSFRALTPASPGSARIKPAQRALRLDDGTLFVPAGCDLSRFAVKDGIETFTQKFVELERLHCNAAAMALSRAFPLEGPTAGHIDPKVAEQLDAIFMSAQVRNIKIVLALETGLDLGVKNSQHLYMSEQGGPLIASPEFFRNPAARRFYQARMAYCAARYGAYRSLLCWELMRNFDDAWPDLKKEPTDKSIDPLKADASRNLRRDVEEWADLMAQQLRGLDQHNHPIAASVALDPSKGWTDLAKTEHIDWILYRDFAEAGARTAEGKFPRIDTAFERWARETRQPGRAKKTWSVAGFGVPVESANALLSPIVCAAASAPFLPADPAKAFDAEERGLLNAAGIFSAAMAEISAYDPTDEIAPSLLSVNGLEPGKAQVRAYARAGRRGIAAWIVRDNAVDETPLDLRLPGVSEGPYQVTWMNPDGTFVSTVRTDAPARQAGQGLLSWSVKSPPFKNAIALFVVRENKW